MQRARGMCTRDFGAVVSESMTSMERNSIMTSLLGKSTKRLASPKTDLPRQVRRKSLCAGQLPDDAPGGTARIVIRTCGRPSKFAGLTCQADGLASQVDLFDLGFDAPESSTIGRTGFVTGGHTGSVITCRLAVCPHALSHLAVPDVHIVMNPGGPCTHKPCGRRTTDALCGRQKCKGHCNLVGPCSAPQHQREYKKKQMAAGKPVLPPTAAGQPVQTQPSNALAYLQTLSPAAMQMLLDSLSLSTSSSSTPSASLPTNLPPSTSVGDSPSPSPFTFPFDASSQNGGNGWDNDESWSRADLVLPPELEPL
ncbi:hypothetical protein C8F01DRAFT_1286050 [Mycena amicta]|nr:hypothetical protein C8F01DRAFT_1286050 [Mycena amicta]